jgi:hypothetical protein
MKAVFKLMFIHLRIVNNSGLVDVLNK